MAEGVCTWIIRFERWIIRKKVGGTLVDVWELNFIKGYVFYVFRTSIKKVILAEFGVFCLMAYQFSWVI